MDYRHANALVTIRHDEIQNGDLNWRAGSLFRVTNVRTVNNVVRFEGVIVENEGETDSLKGTGFDGGTYGARLDVPATIVRRDFLSK